MFNVLIDSIIVIMKKDYFKINFIYIKDDIRSYCFIKAISSEIAKQLVIQEFTNTNCEIKIIDCVKITEKEYKNAIKNRI